MKIIWEDVREIGEYMKRFGLKKVCENEVSWQGAGFIIADDGYGKKAGFPVEESVAEHNGDYYILTPYAKELSWLYRNILNYEMENGRGMELVNESFCMACKGFFLMRPKHTAKQLVSFVNDFVCGVLGREEIPEGK